MSSSKVKTPKVKKSKTSSGADSKSAGGVGVVALRSSNEEAEQFVRGKPAFDYTSTAAKPTHDSDNLFGTKPSTAKKPNKKRKKATGDSSTKVHKKRRSTNENKITHAHFLSYGSLAIGMTIVGAVKQVNELDLTVSLPNGLNAYLSLREVSDIMSELVDAYINADDDDSDEENDSDDLPKLSDLFSPGQLIRGVVISLDKKNNKKRIELSMRPSLFNKPLQSVAKKDLKGLAVHGSVKSIEDHGVVIALGKPSSPLLSSPFPSW